MTTKDANKYWLEELNWSHPGFTSFDDFLGSLKTVDDSNQPGALTTVFYLEPIFTSGRSSKLHTLQLCVLFAYFAQLADEDVWLLAGNAVVSTATNPMSIYDRKPFLFVYTPAGENAGILTFPDGKKPL